MFQKYLLRISEGVEFIVSLEQPPVPLHVDAHGHGHEVLGEGHVVRVQHGLLRDILAEGHLDVNGGKVST